MNALSLLLLSILGAEQTIDAFQYTDLPAAREAWVAKSETPPVGLVDDDNHKALEVIAPFGGEDPPLRTVIDRNVRLDLAGAGGFTLDVACDRPDAIAHLTLYFRSGNGWYGANGSVGPAGWQTLRFSKASFRSEESPAGWQRIDGIRIAAWRGRAENAVVRFRRLTAVSHEVALVIPDAAGHDGDGEVQSALATAELVAGMLAELGLGSDAIDEEAVVRDALGARRIAVLAYNPRLSDDTAAAVQRFVESGGKLLVCYCLPTRIATLLGFERGQYHRQKELGEFAEIRFDATDVPGLPRSVKQASWNISTAKPVAHGARVIGRWYDDDGRPTGHPAMLLSDRGAFLTHTVLSDDREGKKEMLAAVLGRFDQSLWQQMAEAELDRADMVGHCGGLEELVNHARGHAPNASGELVLPGSAMREAEKLLAQRQYPESVQQARKAHRLLANAYLRLQTSPSREGRAVWNHSGTGAYAGDWERSAKVLADGGFNMVLPNMLWAGRAHYASEVLPRSSTFDKYGDQVKQCCEAARRHGLEVHVWKVNYNLQGAPKSFVDQLRREGRLQQTAGGEEHPWLCPSHPANKQLELESMLEVARLYPIDGLHFDYIRYPGADSCYCDGCRRRFEAHAGRRIADWPADCRRGALSEKYNDWRCRQITDLVEAVHREGKKLRSELKISAAVFGSYPACRDSIAQDWPEWIKAGYLDFVCPMDYTNSDQTFSNLVANQQKLVGRRIPIYPGIGATASRSRLSPDRVVGQIYHARRLGADGFTVFNFSRGTAESIVPGVGLGAGSQRATPPHANPQPPWPR